MKKIDLQKAKRKLAGKISEKAINTAKKTVGRSTPCGMHETPVPKELKQE